MLDTKSSRSAPISSVVIIGLLLLMFFKPYPSLKLGSALRQVFILLPVLASAYLYFIFVFRVGIDRVSLNKKIVYFSVVVFFSVFLSLLVNIADMNLRSAAELARPFYFLFCGLVFYHLSSRSIKIWFFNLLILFALLQVFVAILQIVAPGAVAPLGIIYSSDKVQTGIVRGVGPLGNPNIMAIYIMAATIVAELTFTRFRFYLITPVYCLGIMLTGSVFSIIIYFGLLSFLAAKHLYAKFKESFFNAAIILVAAPIILVLLLFTFNYLIELSPRLSAILEFLKRLSSLAQIIEFHNLAGRINTWQKAAVYFWDLYSQNTLVLLFGAGPRKNSVLGILDNDYLFIFFRYGILGISVYLGSIIYIYHLARKSMDDHLSIFVRYILCIFIASSLVYDTLSSWAFMPLYLPVFSFLMREVDDRAQVGLV